MAKTTKKRKTHIPEEILEEISKHICPYSRLKGMGDPNKECGDCDRTLADIAHGRCPYLTSRNTITLLPEDRHHLCSSYFE